MADRWKWKAVLIIFTVFPSIYAVDNCEDGKFGWKCKFDCYCSTSYEVCNKLTGECSSGCLKTRYGHGCQLLKAFKYDVKGQGYIGFENQTEMGLQCVSWNNSITVILNGLKAGDFPDNEIPGAVCRNPTNKALMQESITKLGPWCFTDVERQKKGFCDIILQSCPDGLFGEDCHLECHCANISEACNKKIGTCASGCYSGWIGPSCQEKCPGGTYGINCVSKCGNCKNDMCDFEDGTCLEGCNAGWKGKLCKTACSNGEYGEDCAFSCGMCQNGTCNRIDGTCPEGCQDGYQGPRCQQACDKGYYGSNCSNTCGHCKSDACRHTDGSCADGCHLGWLEPLCQTSCPEFSYGDNCSLTCGQCRDSKTCEKDSGLCLEGCRDGYTGSLCIAMLQKEESNSLVIAVVVAVLVVLILSTIIILVILYRRRKFQQVLKVQGSQDEEGRKKGIDDPNSTKETDQLLSSLSESMDNTDPNDNLQEPIYANVNTKKQTSPIKIKDLFEYIQEYKKNDCEGFKKEFGELPHGLMALCETAKKPENRPKNRYGNITAYDHSRVRLDPVPNEAGSDYINANFMQGYNKPEAYIASQGPTKVMIRDFWRMVWQKRVCKIVMLTNLMEACKKKCEQYWPDEGSVKYGETTVEVLDTAVFTDFTIRTFKVACGGSSRIVKQFHFTSWSDHGALTYPTPLLTFKRKVKMYSPDSTAPIIIHCSAGIGRSGTYIALDYLLDQAKAEGLVDVLLCGHLMRSNRINMIQTWEQYVFVYEALLEALNAGDTTISQSAFRVQYEEMTTKQSESSTTPLEEQFKILQKLTPSVDSSQYKAALSPENIDKNRVKNVLPANRCRPHLYTQVEGCNDYINAVFLPGYTQRDTFIVTQMPLPNTVADCWRMLYDYNSHTVIMLNEFDRNDKTCALYWPEEYGYTVEYDPLSIELLSSTEEAYVSVRIFKLSNHIKKEERAIKMFQLKSWPEHQKVPNNTTSVMQLMDLVYDWLKQNGRGPITVHCMNGATKSGLFCAVYLMFERMQRDREVDVFQTIKTIRVNRPQFIEDMEQYNFCYQMAGEYLEYYGL